MAFMNKLDKILYPGSFDPITLGHEDLIRQATRLASTLVVAVAEDNQKKSLFTCEQRVLMLQVIQKNYPNLEVVSYTGLTIDLLKKLNVQNMIRGLRNEIDYINERDLHDMNRILSPEVNTVFMQSDPGVRSISSTIVRQLIHLKKDFSPFVSKEIFNLISSWH